jgi:hypothetical protein
MALEPDSVIEVVREVVDTSLVTSDQELPALTDALRTSPLANAALRVAVRVCEAVLVLKSLALVPLSVDMSTLLKLIVGAVKSMLTDPVSAEVSTEPSLPAVSAKFPPAVTEKVAVPAVSSPLRVSAQVWSEPLAPAVPVSPSIVQAGLPCSVSEGVMVNVTTSPDLAWAVLELSEAIAICSVGAVVSRV